jgi:hypothetical protein
VDIPKADKQHDTIREGAVALWDRRTGDLPPQDQQLVAQYCDLHVFGVRWRTGADQPEDLPDDHESQGAYHHGLIVPARRRAWSQS